MAEAVRATYTGDGSEFLEGIPARDITEDEWAAMTNEQRAAVRESDLYKTKTDAEAKSSGTTDKAADPSDKTESTDKPEGGGN